MEGLAPDRGALLGAFVEPRGGQTHEEALEELESLIGRRLDLDHQYYAWDDPIPTQHETLTVEQGRIPLISWKAARRSDRSVVPWSSIARGDEDSVIAERADAFRSFGHPVMFIFNHEPEKDHRMGTPEEFVAAWRHIHDVFSSRGVTNVAWVLTLFGSSYRNGDVEQFYPGDDYVDWVAGDGYNFYGTNPGPRGCSRPWKPFSAIFGGLNQWASERGKPALAVETGTTEDPADPNRKAQWFTEALATLKSWPNFKGLVYFNSDRTQRSGCNWLIESSDASVDAFRDTAEDPYLDTG